MSFKILLLLPALLWPAQPAKAAIGLQCATPESIEESAEECDSNDSFTTSGQNCVTSLENMIKARTAVINKQMAAAQAAGIGQAGNAQNHDLATSNVDYTTAQNTFADLTKAATSARTTVDSYLDHIYFPEDFDAPEEVIGDPETFLDESPCFADNEAAIKAQVAKLDKDIADLLKSKAAALALGNLSQANKVSLDQSSATNSPLIKAQHPTGDLTGQNVGGSSISEASAVKDGTSAPAPVIHPSTANPYSTPPDPASGTQPWIENILNPTSTSTTTGP